MVAAQTAGGSGWPRAAGPAGDLLLEPLLPGRHGLLGREVEDGAQAVGEGDPPHDQIVDGVPGLGELLGHPAAGDAAQGVAEALGLLLGGQPPRGRLVGPGLGRLVDGRGGQHEAGGPVAGEGLVDLRGCRRRRPSVRPLGAGARRRRARKPWPVRGRARLGRRPRHRRLRRQGSTGIVGGWLNPGRSSVSACVIALHLSDGLGGRFRGRRRGLLGGLSLAGHLRAISWALQLGHGPRQVVRPFGATVLTLVPHLQSA